MMPRPTDLRSLERVKAEFVSLASHQLRTPLTSISWYSEMLLEDDTGVLNPDQRKYIQGIHTATRQMVDLVNALLDTSRIDMNTFVIEPRPFDVVVIAKEVIQDIEPLVFKKKQNLIEDYSPRSLVVKIDPKLTRMIIQNLLMNAVKYTPAQGKIRLRIKKGVSDFKIQVSDSGYGIPKSQQAHIFTKMFRADNVRMRETEGTGLGLYIVKSILETAGGKISFKSVEGVGSTFTVSLPMGGMIAKKGTKELG
jgi:signal transduction histidine kinase